MAYVAYAAYDPCFEKKTYTHTGHVLLVIFSSGSNNSRKGFVTRRGGGFVIRRGGGKR